MEVKNLVFFMGWESRYLIIEFQETEQDQEIGNREGLGEKPLTFSLYNGF